MEKVFLFELVRRIAANISIKDVFIYWQIVKQILLNNTMILVVLMVDFYQCYLLNTINAGAYGV